MMSDQDPSQNRPTKIIRFDGDYVVTVPGILKLAQLACNTIGFLCIKISTAWISPILYNVLYWAGNVVTLFMLLMYTFHFVEKFNRLPWLKLEMYFCCGMVLAYLGCSIFAMTLAENTGYAVGFFGFCAIIAYAFDAYLKFKTNRRGLSAQ